MSRAPTRLDEFGLIARHFAPLAANAPGAFSLTDDAAAIDVAPGERIVVTTDAMVAGVHFPAGDPADLIARKLLRVNLSDLAAMGAEPHGYTLAAAFAPDTADDWIARFASGLAQDQAEFGVSLIGGDTVSTPGPAMFSLTAFGTVEGDALLRRGGAGPGDDAWVSGTIGDALLGLALVERRLDVSGDAERTYLVDRFRLPEPRIAVGRALVGCASAAADVSDGLIADLGHICTISGCSAELAIADIPLSPAARLAVTDRQELHHSLLAGGDDYELVFAAPVAARGRIDEISRQTGIRLTRIGRFVAAGEAGPAVACRDADGNRIDLGHGGYEHFGEAR